MVVLVWFWGTDYARSELAGEIIEILYHRWSRRWPTSSESFLFLLKASYIVFCLTTDASPLICHYDDVIMGTIASQITSLTSVYSTVYSGADQSKHQSSASLAFVWGIHRGPVNSPHKWPVTRKMFPFDDVIMLKEMLNNIIWSLQEIMWKK